jgi:hypothetical protein
MHGTFVWNELATHDVEAARAFYAEALGWTFEEFPLPQGPYWVAKSGERVVGGLGGMETGAVPGDTPYWFAFVEVDDVDARLAKAAALGATVLQPPEDVPGVGRVAVLRDPTGAAIGWMTSPRPDPVAHA